MRDDEVVEVGDGDGIDRAGWDASHRATEAPTLRRIRRATLWRRLPPGVEPTTIWPSWPLDRLTAELEVAEGETLVDVACGRGDLGVAIASRLGTRLVGVEPSEVGRATAARAARSAGLPQATFVDGHLLALNLPHDSADAALVVDALQFAPDRPGALRELARVLRPGRRLVVIGPTRVGDDWADLVDAGFVIEVHEETAGWRDTVADFAARVRAAAEDLRRELDPTTAETLLTAPFEELQRTLWHGLVVARRAPG